MTAAEFKKKWSRNQSKESAAYQEHFNDLCRLLGQRQRQLPLRLAAIAALTGKGSHHVRRATRLFVPAGSERATIEGHRNQFLRFRAGAGVRANRLSAMAARQRF